MSILFSRVPIAGKRISRIVKYENDAIWPMMMNGCSTGWLPTQVRMRRLATRNQNRVWESGRKVMVRCLDL